MDSMGKRILEGLNYSLIGMTVTILSLLTLTFIIILMSKLINSLSNRRSGASGMTGGSGVPGAPGVSGLPGGTGATGGSSGSGSPGGAAASIRNIGEPTIIKETNAAGGTNMPGGELIAIFAAAIAQVTGADAASLRIVSYNRTKFIVPVWNIRGRNEYLSGKI